MRTKLAGLGVIAASFAASLFMYAQNPLPGGGGGGGGAALAAHIADTANPHSVTKSQVGLGNVSNYADASQMEAEAGVATNKFMTPERVAQAIAALASGSSAVSSVQGQTGAVTLFDANPQTTTYTATTTDFNHCKVISTASASSTVTLVASGSQPADGKCVFVLNYGSGTITIARNGQNINGGTASLTLPAGSATAPTGAFIKSDGTNYLAFLFGGSGGNAMTRVGGYLYDGTNYYITGPQLALATRTTCGAFTWRNQGSSTCTDESDGSVTLTPAISASASLRILEVTPASTFTATAHITCDLPFADFFGSGMVLIESGTGKVTNFGITSTATASSAWVLVKNIWSSVTAFVSQVAYTPGNTNEWLRIQLDSTNLTFSKSIDGVKFSPVAVTTKGTGFTTAPDRVGWMVNNQHASLGATCTLRSWLVQ